MAQQLINTEKQLLRDLTQLVAHKPELSEKLRGSINVSRSNLNVYFAFLQNDKEKMRRAINAAQEVMSDTLTSVTESNSSLVSIVDTKDEHDYLGDKNSENTRQVAEAFKINAENFEFLFNML